MRNLSVLIILFFLEVASVNSASQCDDLSIDSFKVSVVKADDGTNNGAIKVKPLDGEKYYYAFFQLDGMINKNAESNSIENLHAGKYICRIMREDGCKVTLEFEV